MNDNTKPTNGEGLNNNSLPPITPPNNNPVVDNTSPAAVPPMDMVSGVTPPPMNSVADITPPVNVPTDTGMVGQLPPIQESQAPINQQSGFTNTGYQMPPVNNSVSPQTPSGSAPIGATGPVVGGGYDIPNTPAMVSFYLGLLGLILPFLNIILPFLGYSVFLSTIAGIVLGIMGLKNPNKKGFAIAGLILNILILIGYGAMIIIGLIILSALGLSGTNGIITTPVPTF